MQHIPSDAEVVKFVEDQRSEQPEVGFAKIVQRLKKDTQTRNWVLSEKRLKTIMEKHDLLHAPKKEESADTTTNNTSEHEQDAQPRDTSAVTKKDKKQKKANAEKDMSAPADQNATSNKTKQVKFVDTDKEQTKAGVHTQKQQVTQSEEVVDEEDNNDDDGDEEGEKDSNNNADTQQGKKKKKKNKKKKKKANKASERVEFRKERAALPFPNSQDGKAELKRYGDPPHPLHNLLQRCYTLLPASEINSSFFDAAQYYTLLLMGKEQTLNKIQTVLDSVVHEDQTPPGVGPDAQGPELFMHILIEQYKAITPKRSQRFNLKVTNSADGMEEFDRYVDKTKPHAVHLLMLRAYNRLPPHEINSKYYDAAQYYTLLLMGKREVLDMLQQVLEATVVQNEMPENVGPDSVADGLFMYYLIEEFKAEVQRAKQRAAAAAAEATEQSTDDKEDSADTTTEQQLDQQKEELPVTTPEDATAILQQQLQQLQLRQQQLKQQLEQ